jgi:hypothetical protein
MVALEMIAMDALLCVVVGAIAVVAVGMLDGRHDGEREGSERTRRPSE